MSKKKKKYYTVWVGHTPGVYENWNACQAQIKGFGGAKYKSFSSLAEAKSAFDASWQQYYETKPAGKKGSPSLKSDPGDYVHEKYGTIIVIDSIAVDAACSGNPGKMEYRGVQTVSKKEIFHSPVFPVGTNNIGEFLAIVHALALYSSKQPGLTIYTDSRIAMGWVKKGKCKTNLPRTGKTAHLYQVIARAENWLKTNTFKNPIIKWETKEWGEIPADFGRK